MIGVDTFHDPRGAPLVAHGPATAGDGAPGLLCVLFLTLVTWQVFPPILTAILASGIYSLYSLVMPHPEAVCMIGGECVIVGEVPLLTRVDRCL